MTDQEIMKKGDRVKVVGGSTGYTELIGKVGTIIELSTEIGYDVKLDDDTKEYIYLRDDDIAPLNPAYNATKALQQEIADMVEDALTRAGYKYIRVYFNDIGTLIIEKERE